MCSGSASESHRNAKWWLWDTFLAGRPCGLALTSLCLVILNSCEPHLGEASLCSWCSRTYLEVSDNNTTSLPVFGHLTLSCDCAKPHCIYLLLNACHVVWDHQSFVMSYNILPSFSMQSHLVFQSVINVVHSTRDTCRYLCEAGHKNIYQALNLESSLSTVCHLPFTPFHCKRCLCLKYEPQL